MQDFSEPVLRDVESGKLQKSAETGIGCSERWGMESRDIATLTWLIGRFRKFGLIYALLESILVDTAGRHWPLVGAGIYRQPSLRAVDRPSPAVPVDRLNGCGAVSAPAPSGALFLRPLVAVSC
jgi:hypothetical protein